MTHDYGWAASVNGSSPGTRRSHGPLGVSRTQRATFFLETSSPQYDENETNVRLSLSFNLASIYPTVMVGQDESAKARSAATLIGNPENMFIGEVLGNGSEGSFATMNHRCGRPASRRPAARRSVKESRTAPGSRASNPDASIAPRTTSAVAHRHSDHLHHHSEHGPGTGSRRTAVATFSFTAWMTCPVLHRQEPEHEPFS
jgi:hypothetical protein